MQFGLGALAGMAVGQLHDGNTVPMAAVVGTLSCMYGHKFSASLIQA